MDGKGSPPRGDALRGNPPPRTTSVLGCISVGVGSPPPRSVSIGTMVKAGDIATHQHLGDESPVPSKAGFPGHDHQPASDSHVRQLHCGGVRQQTGTVSDSLCELTGQLLSWTEAHNVSWKRGTSRDNRTS